MTLAAIGTGISAFSSITQGISNFRAGQYRAQVAEKNKLIAEENARRAIERAQAEQQDQDIMALVLLGEQEAAQGASGLSFGSRSFALTRRASRELARRDALRTREGGEVEARNFRQQALDFENQAGFERSSARGSLLEGFLGAGSSLISGAAKVRNRKRYVNESFESLLGRRRALS